MNDAAIIQGPLLPPNATPFERSVELAGSERHPLPAELVASVWDPATCPAAALPWLAWGLSIDLWDESWPEIQKREVCRKALRLHRIKTTPAGIKAHVALTGATVEKITRPPARGFLRGAMNEAQRIAWLNDSPQVRIYPFFNRAVARLRHSFPAGPAGLRFHGTAARSHLLASRGSSLHGRRATWYDRGEEFEITLAPALGALVERVLIRRTGAFTML